MTDSICADCLETVKNTEVVCYSCKIEELEQEIISLKGANALMKASLLNHIETEKTLKRRIDLLCR